MEILETSAGSFIEAPDGVKITEASDLYSSLSSEDSVYHHGLILADEIYINPEREVSALGRSHRSRVRLRTKLKKNEKSVLLVESEGVFQWVLPNEEGISGASGDLQSDTFEIELSPPSQQSDTSALFLRKIAGKIWEAAKVYVFKFVVKASVKFAARKIDGKGPFGLFEIKKSNDLNSWIPKRSNRLKSLNPEKKRVLLFIHGTFSSTHDNYGSLADVSDFTNNLSSKYDAVLGFDHRTLQEDIVQNAESLAEAFQRIDTNGQTCELDILGYSRGGLVLRWFVEKELQNLEYWKFGKGIFFGAPLAGTSLANPGNWAALVDVYTNTLVAAANALGLVTGGSAGAVISAVTKAMGGFVKYLAEVGTEPDTVPGLASMTPGNPLIGRLQDDSYPEAKKYSAFVSNYEPDLSGTLLAKAKMIAADKIADRFFGEDNDLVVQTKSMSALDRDTEVSGKIISFGPEESVMHTAYLSSDRVITNLNNMLGLTKPSSTQPRSTSRSSRPKVAITTTMSGPENKSPVPTGRLLVMRNASSDWLSTSSSNDRPQETSLFENLKDVGVAPSEVLSLQRKQADVSSSSSGSAINLGFEMAIIDPYESTSTSSAAMTLRNDPRFKVEPEYYVTACSSDFADRRAELLLKERELRAREQELFLDGFSDRNVQMPLYATPNSPSVKQPATSEQAFTDKSIAWHLQIMGITNVTAETGRGLKIAILDTGVDLGHPDFQHQGDLSSPARSRNFVDKSPNASVQDDNGHGTHVAGLVAGRSPNSLGYRYSAAPNAELYVAKVLDRNGDGKEGDIISGIIWALENGCDIINMSLGRRARDTNDLGAEYTNIIEACLEAECLPIAAAGNDSSRREHGLIGPIRAPACNELVMSVGAINRSQSIADFSNGSVTKTGEIHPYTKLEIVAPGVDIWSSHISHEGYIVDMGTSMACPLVSGLSALIAERTGLRGAKLWDAVIHGTISLGHSKQDEGNGLAYLTGF